MSSIKEITASYLCHYHKWESWTHYGCKMWENGCKLPGKEHGCKYTDASMCPDFIPRAKKED